jgi:hypothetical protein
MSMSMTQPLWGWFFWGRVTPSSIAHSRNLGLEDGIPLRFKTLVKKADILKSRKAENFEKEVIFSQRCRWR